MALDLGTLRGRIDADVRGWNKGFSSANKSLSVFGKAVPGILKPVGIAVAAIGAAAVAAAAAITVLTIKAVKDYGQFGHEMAEVSTMIRKNVDENTEALSRSVRQLSLEIPQSTSQLTDALYDILSASVPVNEAMYVMEEAGRAAVGGLSSVQTSANLATGTINALGGSFTEADRVFDVAFSTVRSGKITFEELAGALGQVLPAASKMKASMEEVYGSIAFLTKNAMNAQMASVSFARALDGLGTRADTLEGMGIRVFGEAGDYVGIVKVIEQISEKIQGLSDMAQVNYFEEMGFDIRAARSIVLMANNLDDFRATMDEVADSAGAAGAAYGRMESTLVNQWKILKNSAAELKLTLGESFAEIAATGIERMINMLQGIAGIIAEGGGLVNLWEAHRDLITALLAELTTTGLQLVGAYASGAGEILMAAAVPAWQSFQHKVMKIEEDIVHFAMMKYNEYLDWSSDANTRREAYERDHAEFLVSLNAWHTDKMKVKVDEMSRKITDILTTQAGNTSDAYKEAASALEIALDAIKDKTTTNIQTVTTVVEEETAKQVTVTDRTWAGFTDRLASSSKAVKTVMEGFHREQTDTAGKEGEKQTRAYKVEWDKQTRTYKVELDKRGDLLRGIIDDDMKRREKGFQMGVAFRDKAKGAIRKFFDWEVITAGERSDKLVRNRKMQLLQELTDFDDYYRALSDGEERALMLREAMDIRDLERQNRGWEAGVQLAEEQAQEKLDVQNMFLKSATQNLQNHIGTAESIYNDFLPFFHKYNLDLLKLEKWRADQSIQIKEQELRRYSDIAYTMSGAWRGADETLEEYEARQALLAGDMAGVTRFTNDTTASLGNFEGILGEAEWAAASLGDELAGHSLTSAFDEVQESMSGFSLGIVENIDKILGFADITKVAGEEIIKAERDKNTKMATLFEAFLGGKIASARETNALLLEVANEYQVELQNITARKNQAFLEAQLRQRRAIDFIWESKMGGMLSASAARQIQEQILGGNGAVTEGPSERQGLVPGTQAVSPAISPAININIENLYGGNEATLNDFAEDIARRIRAQNITI